MKDPHTCITPGEMVAYRAYKVRAHTLPLEQRVSYNAYKMRVYTRRQRVSAGNEA